MKLQEIVNWDTYAQKYDMLLEYNPFYQQLHEEVLAKIKEWETNENTVFADIGAGTGNYSIAMAKYFPQAKILHIDKDAGMNAQAARKVSEKGLKNHYIFEWSADKIPLLPASLNGLISVHALYTFPNPQSILLQMYKWLKPGGKAILVNAGRVVNVLDWQLAIGRYMLQKYGIRRTLQVFRKGKEVSKQNIKIRKMQREGIFWTHTHKEFCQEVETAGFEIESHKICFRGASDFVVAKKRS